MKRLAILWAAAALCLPGVARSSTGQDTLIIWEYTGGFRDNVSTGASTDLPPVGFSVPESGSGSFGASAHAAPLELGASGFIQALGNNACKCVGVGAYVNAIAATQETFDLPGPIGLPAFLVLNLEVSGSAVGTATGTGKFTLPPHGAVTVTARAGIDDVPVTAAGLGGANYHPVPTFLASAAPTTTPIRLEVPFFFGTAWTLWLSLSSVMEGGATDGTVDAIVDYGSTLHIVSVEVVDAQHQPIEIAEIVGGSGTSYPVPEPSAAVLAGLALVLAGLALALGCARRVTR